MAMWSDFYWNSSGVEACRGANYVDTQASVTVDALTDSEGFSVNTAIEKQEIRN
jgi:hypothetical protein